MAKKAIKKDKSTAAKTGSPAARKRGRGRHFFIYILVGVLLMLSPPIAALLIVGLLPTLTMLLADTGAYKSLRLNAMFAFNLAGVLPFMVQLWDAGASMDGFKTLAGDLTVWAIMYGAAFVGATMLWLGPVLAAAAQQILNGEAARRVEKQLKLLVEEWGDDVIRSSAAQDKKGAPSHPKTGAGR
ncbi:MAG: hypothetical protein D6807_05235 [Alphaproteobacteria bacterium]|nr:MAG: hypothetical protein D6807_05235 [Alphaproteobacteria bacterium]